MIQGRSEITQVTSRCGPSVGIGEITARGFGQAGLQAFGREPHGMFHLTRETLAERSTVVLVHFLHDQGVLQVSILLAHLLSGPGIGDHVVLRGDELTVNPDVPLV